MTQSSEIKKKRVNFKIKAGKGKKVFVAGTFNGWNPEQNRLKLRDGYYSTGILLTTGKHEYKFVVDGAWLSDPENREWVPNEHGTLNSVVTVMG